MTGLKIFMILIGLFFSISICSDAENVHTITLDRKMGKTSRSKNQKVLIDFHKQREE